ncbi:hypothetical protein [Cohnella fermenti]|uniref:hypothetical protein n=1 Tax=Cohnella fermenti TaxID=2565925 RepID=UPI001454C675|nr:hypothetical protein [Cohnella fermenti]
MNTHCFRLAGLSRMSDGQEPLRRGGSDRHRHALIGASKGEGRIDIGGRRACICLSSMRCMAGEGMYEQYAKIAPTYGIDNIGKSWRETLRRSASCSARSGRRRRDFGRTTRRSSERRSSCGRSSAAGMPPSW